MEKKRKYHRKEEKKRKEKKLYYKYIEFCLLNKNQFLLDMTDNKV